MTEPNLPSSSSSSSSSSEDFANKAPVAPSKKPQDAGRRSWHRRASKPVQVWMFALFILIFVHRWVPQSIWLMVHMVTLGLITNSILIWSQYFTEALLKLKLEEETRRLQVGRIYALNASMVVLMVGVVLGIYPLTLIGSFGVGTVVAWHGLNLLLQLRKALPARFDVTVRFYIVASWLLPVGAVFGALLAQSTLENTLYHRLLLAHETVNILGFVGLTVVGTLLTLWPTMLRTKMHPAAVKYSKIGLSGMVAGTGTTTIAALFGSNLAAGAGLVIYAISLLVVATLMVRTCTAKKPSNYPTLSVAAGFCWLLVGVIWVAAQVFTRDFSDLHLRSVTPVFVAGFLLQVLLGAMSYLLPVRMGGGPAAVRTANREFNRFSFGRVTIINICLLFFVLPAEFTGSMVRAVTSVLGAMTFAVFIPLMVRGVKKSVAARKEMMAARARGEAPPPQTEPAQNSAPKPRREILIGGGAALAAVAAGIALDPSAVRTLRLAGSNMNSSNAAVTKVTVEATGDMRFVPNTLVVPRSNRLIVEVKNIDTTNVHDLFIDLNGGKETGRINPGESRTVDAGVVEQSAEGWCTIIGHRAMGMTLNITVSGDQAHTGHSGHNSSTAGGESALMRSSDIDLAAPLGEGFTPRNAMLSPIGKTELDDGRRVHRAIFDVAETEQEIAPGVSVNSWTFDGQYMGPTLHGALGDIFEIKLINNGTMGHSLDFHAGMVSPDENMRTIAPGEELIYRFEATGSGIWLYHCSTMPMSSHIAAGMFGAVVIDPSATGDVDREFVLVQNETYLIDTGRAAENGNRVTEISPEAVDAGLPTLTMWNGHATQYVAEPLTAKVGEKIRIWVLAAGPSKGCSFHVVGSQFHTVYKEGAYLLRDSRDAFGVEGGHAQSLDLASAQGGFVEMEFLEPGTYTFVNHSFAEMERGARGLIKVSG